MIKFNDILDKIGMKELSDDLVVKINNAGQAAITKLNEHINDSTVHVTSTEKDNWNSKAPNHSPNFTGEPTAPTTVQSTNNDQIATTRYVTEKINAWVPDVANEAKKLVSKNNFSIKGAITSSVQSFDGTGNVVLVVDNVPTRSLAGVIDPLNLDGTYNISITGTAGSANNASSLGGVLAKDFAKLESPTFTGKPKAPTAEAGDSSMQIANTNYVTNAINAIHFPEDVKTAEKLKNPVTFKISGKVISNEVVFDGSENVDLKVTTVNIQDQLDAYMPTKVNNHTVDSDVPVNAVFTDTVYTHPDTVQDLTGKSYTQVVVDRQGHVVYGANPDNLAVSIAGNAATATKLANTFKIKLTGDAVTTDATGVTDGQNDATLSLDSINANAIATDEDHRLVTDDEKANYLDKYTKAEMDAKLEKFKLDSGFDIIGSSDTEEDIATDFPHPVDGNVVVVKSTGLLYRFNGVSWRCMAEYTLVTKTKNGLMSAVDKVKLDGIEEGANNFTLPDELPASMITEDESRKFITFDEKTKLDNLYTKEQIDQHITSATPEATINKAGLLSAADKIKLDSIETGANKYVLPKTLPASIMTEDEEHRFTTDTEKASYADKYTKVEVNTLISNATPLASHTVNGLMRSTDKVKLDGIEEGANNYKLPDTLPASMITEDETHQFVTSTDKTVYADKFTKAETRDAIAKATPIVTTGTAGLMTAADKAKLDGIAANANKYVLPSTLPASMITEDVNHRFVTDQDKSDYADKYTKVEVEGLINAAKPEIVTKKAAGLMSASDKAKLDGIEANANKYVLPKTLPATMITEDKDHRFVTDLEKTTYLDKYTKNETIDLIDAAKPGVVTQEFNGLMSSTDKTKLDGIAEGANNYVLPDTLPASMIVPDEQHQFVNLTEKASYADKYTKAETQNLITTSIQNANTDGMIWQKDVNSFSDIATTYPDPKKGWTVSVNDTGKIYRYNGTEWVSLSGTTATYQLATQTEDGLMAATDKTKLDGIEAGANNYVLPKTLPANMITTTDDKQFISSVEKTSYADKYTKAEVTNLIKEAKPANATTAAAGLMSAADKAKLDGIEANANRYVLPNYIPASMIETSDDLQFVSQTEKTSYADKYTKAETVNLINQHVPDVVTTKTNGLMIAADKVKLDGIEANANHYVLPETLPASMITEDETHKFITTAEKAKIANSYNKDEIIKIVSEATPSASDTKAGLMSAADKAKLDGIAPNANNYTLPATLPASMITTTADKQFISNTEKTSYADKYTKAEVDQKLTDIASGNINLSTYTRYKGNISADQLAGFEPYSGKIEKDDLFFQGSGLIIITKSKTESTAPEYQRLSTLSLADSSSAGLMSTADKSKLDGIEAGANNYKLPSTLPASMITEDETHKFITSAEKADYQKTITSATANGATITFNHKDGTTSTATVNNVASATAATNDAKGQKIDATYEKIADASNVHTSLQNSINSLSTGKQDKLTFDTTPTANSSNPVTSRGIKTALDAKLDKTGTAVSATKLQTALTINFNGAVDGNVTFDGSKNVSVTLSEFTHVEAIIDLTDTTKYDTDTYYPVVSNFYTSSREHKYRCWTPIHSVETAPWGNWGGSNGDYSAELKITDIMNGWGAQKNYATIDINSCNGADVMPITYFQMPSAGRSVFFVRGGGKYWISSTRNAAWELKTDTFTVNRDTVAPTKTYFTPESKNIIKTVGINISGNANSATKLATPRAISLTGNASGSTTFDGSGNVSINTTVNAINNQGKKEAIQDGTAESYGLNLYEVYLNGYPTGYGNLISIGGAGGGELLAGWAAEDHGVAHLYYRNRREHGTFWSNWSTVAFTTDINNYAPTKTGGGASGTWNINITGTATKATQDASGNVITDTYATKTEVATKAASTTKVYTRDSVTNNISSFPANSGIFLIEEPDTITIPR